MHRKSLKDMERAIERETQNIEGLEEEMERATVSLNEAKRNTMSLLHQNEKLKLLAEAKSSGAIPGIHGRLGDLGSIDVRYDEAISNCSAALDYIVVESVEDAEAAGELLKQKKMSPLTFLILNKQTDLVKKMQTVFQTPEGAQRLFDLVRTQDERMKVAFYYALHDTLVTDTLENATRIAFGGSGRRYTMVTLKGELLRAVGTMTGGGVPLKGKMRLGEMPVHPMLNPTEAAQIEEAAAHHLRNIQQVMMKPAVGVLTL